MPPRYDDDRLLVRDGWRHFRRRYCLAEVRWGFVVGLALVGITAWVLYKGKHPDPSLLATVIPTGNKASKAVDRGPLPKGLAGAGLVESRVRQFGPATLYEKINGRADYFKSFGFKRLYVALLSDAKDKARNIDIELYDMGKLENALGAYAGEVPKGAEALTIDGGQAVIARNLLLMARGRFLLRAVGPDEGKKTKDELERLAGIFSASLHGKKLPWAYGLFAALDVSPKAINYARNNAFSFDFASGVTSAKLDEQSEGFVMLAADDAGAKALAERFVKGFEGYGKNVGDKGSVDWIKDRYIGSISGAISVGRVVVGVRAAPDLLKAKAALERLRRAVAALPAGTFASANTETKSDKAPKKDDSTNEPPQEH